MLFIVKFATVPAKLFANIPTDLSPFTVIFPAAPLIIDNLFVTPEFIFP